ncbi:MAG: MGMT family protein [Bacteroidales bacterium]|nr:MGMT family protein [Bacteroidales bacterium]
MERSSKNRLNQENQSFFDRVYEVVRLIPEGRVTTYGAIARYIGAPQSARLVGWAMNASHYWSGFIPAHRVVNRIGVLTGKNHFRYGNLMQELLESEGIKIENDQIEEFDKVFWDPYKELI